MWRNAGLRECSSQFGKPDAPRVESSCSHFQSDTFLTARRPAMAAAANPHTRARTHTHSGGLIECVCVSDGPLRSPADKRTVSFQLLFYWLRFLFFYLLFWSFYLSANFFCSLMLYWTANKSLNQTFISAQQIQAAVVRVFCSFSPIRDQLLAPGLCAFTELRRDWWRRELPSASPSRTRSSRAALYSAAFMPRSYFTPETPPRGCARKLLPLIGHVGLRVRRAPFRVSPVPDVSTGGSARRPGEAAEPSQTTPLTAERRWVEPAPRSRPSWSRPRAAERRVFTDDPTLVRSAETKIL